MGKKMNLPECRAGVPAPCRYADAGACRPAVQANGWAGATYVRYTDQGGHDIPPEVCCQQVVTVPSDAAACPGVLIDGAEIYTCDDSKGYFDTTIGPVCFGCRSV